MPEQIWQTIEESWSHSAAWPEFIEAMRRITPCPSNQVSKKDRDPSNWAVLPGLCCQAAGGKAEWAKNIAAGWLLFYIAADIMDTVEDADQPDARWDESSSGAAINIASGLFFSAVDILNQVYNHVHSRQAAEEIVARLIDGFLIMCSGQHNDLVKEELTLDGYWKTAGAKSGEFFGMACWTGARINIQDAARLNCYQDFGSHLGMLIQILDDLEEFNSLNKLNTELEWKKIQKSLPVVYTMEVVKNQKKSSLIRCLNHAHQDQESVEEAIQIMEESGVVIYLLSEIERHSKLALSRLDDAGPEADAAKNLAGMVKRITSQN